MNKGKKIFLICCLIVLICILAGFIIFIINYKNIDDNPLYGKWIASKSEVYYNGVITSYLESIDDKYIVISNKRIKICYIENNKDICKKYKYTYSNNIMEIEENDLYLSGREEIILDNNKITMKYNLDGNTLYSEMHFKRE